MKNLDIGHQIHNIDEYFYTSNLKKLNVLGSVYIIYNLYLCIEYL